MVKITLPASFRMPTDCRSRLKSCLFDSLQRLVHRYLTAGVQAPPDTISNETGLPVKFIHPPRTLQTVQAALDQIQAVLFKSHGDLTFTGEAVQFRPLSACVIHEIELLVLASGHWLIAAERQPNPGPKAARFNIMLCPLELTFVTEEGSQPVRLSDIVSLEDL